jgi:predicted O-methyltransferase YrrM
VTHDVDTAYNGNDRGVQSTGMHENVRGTARRVLAVGVGIDQTTTSPTSALAPDGTLILMEGDPARAEEARRFLSNAGLASRVAVIGGDPRRMLYKLSGPFDLIFCHDSYLSSRDTLEKLLAPGGVLITNGCK